MALEIIRELYALKTNKRAIIKRAGIFLTLILVCIACLLIFSFITTIHAEEIKKSYGLGEKVKIAIPGGGSYRLHITTPTTSYQQKGIGTSVLFKPTEEGWYRIVLETTKNTNQSVYQFYVGTLPPEEEVFDNLSIHSLSNTSLIQPLEPILVGREVRWRINASINQNGVFDVELPKDSDHLSIYDEEHTLLNTSLTEEVTLVLGGTQKRKVSLKARNGSLFSKKYTFEYTTPAPVKYEKEISRTKKLVEVSADDDLGYTNVISESSIPELTRNPASIRLYWEQGERELPFTSEDLNGNGYIDHVRWIIPHLSNQTFQIIIEISDAQHLDSEKNFLRSIYGETRALDGNWSTTINEGEYVRVTFERNLTPENDITIYPKIIKGDPIIEVYRQNGETKLAEFTHFQNEEYSKVYLSALIGEESTFDLRILGGRVQFDHIIDPTTSSYVDGPGIASISTTASTPSQIAALEPGFAAGDNLVFASVQILSTDTLNEIIRAGSLNLSRVGQPSLATNEYAIGVSAANLNNNYFILASDPGAPSNAKYNVTAYASTTAVSMEAKIIALNQITYWNGTDSPSVALSANDISLATVQTRFSDGNNVIIAAFHISNGGTQQNILPGAIRIKNGNTILSSNQFRLTLGAIGTTANQSIVIIALDSNANANSTYNFSISGPSAANAEVKALVFRVTDAEFVDSTNKALPAAITNVTQLTTTFPANSEVAVFAAYQINDSDTNAETLAATSGLLLKENGAIRSSNQYILSAFNASGGAGDGIRHTLLWRNTSISASTFYNLTAQASATGLNGEAKMLILQISDDANPQITFLNPLARNYSINISELNYTYSEQNPGSCWYSNSSGQWNSTVLPGGYNFTGIVSKEGSNTLTLYCNDTQGNANQTNLTFFKDTVFPLINYTTKTLNDALNVTQNSIFVNVSVNETNEMNITFFLYNTTSLVNTTMFVTGNRTINWTNLSDGTYYYNVSIEDIAGNKNSTPTRSLSLDIHSPLISYGANGLLSGANISVNSFIVNVTVTESNEKNITFYLYNTTALLVGKNFTTTVRNVSWTGLADGTYFYNVTVWDDVGNSNSTVTQSVTLDTLFPLINYTSGTQVNFANVSQTFVFINVTVSELREKNITFFLFNSTTLFRNFTFTTAIRNVTFSGLADNLYYYNVTVVDISGNTNSTPTRAITIDTLKPVIRIVSPLNTSYKTSILDFNVTLRRDGSWCGFSYDGGPMVSMSAFNSTYYNYTLTGLLDGSHGVDFSCNDTSGNLNSSSGEVFFTIDTIPPLVNISSPLNRTYGTSIIYFNVSINENSSCMYSLTSGIVNYTMSANASGTGFNATNFTLPNGQTQVWFYCNDSAGNMNASTTELFSVDTLTPLLDIQEPRTLNYSYTALSLNYSVSDTTFTTCWYSNDSGNHNYSLPGCINSSYLAIEGETTLDLWVNDSVGNTNSSSITFQVDLTRPLIVYGEGTNATGIEVEQNWINVNVSVDEEHERNISFYLYNSTGLVRIDNYSIPIRNVTWNDLSDLNVTYFYNVTITDYAGNMNSTETRTIKLIDITNPTLVLDSPGNTTYTYNESIALTYSASDLHLENCSYQIDGDPFITLEGCEGGSFSVSDGQHLLTLRVNDSLGNTNVTSVWFIANSSLARATRGMLAYGQGTQPAPYISEWSGTAFSKPYNSTNLSGRYEWVQIAASSVREEYIIVTANLTDYIYAMVNSSINSTTSCWHNGTQCGAGLLLTKNGSNIDRLKVDVAYESMNGDAVVVYTNLSKGPFYRVWNGSQFGDELPVPQTRLLGGNISFVKLASQPNSNEIALIFSNTTDLSAMIWNSTSTNWSCEPPKVLSAYQGLTPELFQHADIVYEQQSGNLLIVNTINGLAAINYTVKLNGSCTYSTYGRTISLESEGISASGEYGGNYILIGLHDIGANTIQGLVWNGTNMSNISGIDNTILAETVPNREIAPVFAGTSGKGMLFYADVATSRVLDFYNYSKLGNKWDSGPGANTQGWNATGHTVFSIEERNLKAYSYLNSNKSLILAEDTAGRLYAKSYDARTNTFSDVDGGVPLENLLSTVPWISYDFTFRDDHAGPLMSFLTKNFSTYNSSTVVLNVSTSEDSISCLYSLEGGSSNVPMEVITDRIFSSTLSGLDDGNYTVTFLCSDFYSNSRSTPFNFTVDTTLPLLEYGDGTEENSSTFERNWIFVNVSFFDENIQFIQFRIFNQTAKINETFIFDQGYINWTNLPVGNYTYNVTVYDYAMNKNSTELRNLELVMLSPKVSLLYPLDNYNFSGTYTVPYFNYSVLDNSSILNCSLLGNWTAVWTINQTTDNIPIESVVNFSSITTPTDGFYDWNVVCTDSYGNIGRNSTNFTFGTVFPPSLPALYNITQSRRNGAGNITLLWTGGSHAFTYRIYNSTSLQSPFSYLNETTAFNYTDGSFGVSNTPRRFYRVDSWSPASQNVSSEYFAVDIYSLSHTTNTQNWIGFGVNTTYLRNANESLYDITNATSITMWNATRQLRVTCNPFSCPSGASCTSTNCNFNLSRGYGYEVHINSSAPQSVNWSVVGRVYSDFPNFLLEKNTTGFGKNWISLPYWSNISHASLLLQNVTKADAITHWNSTTQKSEGLIYSPFPGRITLGTNFSILPQKAYEVSVNTTLFWRMN